MWTTPLDKLYGSSDKDYDFLFPFHSWTSQPDPLACPHHPWLKPLIHLFGTILHVHFWAQNVRRTETCSNEMGAFERGGGAGAGVVGVCSGERFRQVCPWNGGNMEKSYILFLNWWMNWQKHQSFTLNKQLHHICCFFCRSHPHHSRGQLMAIELPFLGGVSCSSLCWPTPSVSKQSQVHSFHDFFTHHVLTYKPVDGSFKILEKTSWGKGSSSHYLQGF